MKIAIIGAGGVGRALGTGWSKKGHEIAYGVRDPGSAKLADLDRAKFRVVGVSEATKTAEVVVLATPWAATQDAINDCGPLAGKTVLDATNPLLPGLAGMERPEGRSAGEKVAEWAAHAKVVKIFNTTGFNNMLNPDYGISRPVMLYCGDDAGAKAAAKQLSDELGFDSVDAGPLANARYTEALAMLWIWLAVKGGRGRDIAFTLARR